MKITSSYVAAIAVGGTLLFAGNAEAHFVLQEPAAMSSQNNLGNPQKTPPCGFGPDASMTDEVTVYQAGETIQITIDETIFHPGHYRVALAVNDVSELPDDPPVTPGASDCGSTVIQETPVFPVLADGELLHDSAFDGPQSFSVTLPDDVECENCTLQILEFMSSHGAPCYYYHCAAITIEGSGSASSGGAGDSTGNPGATTGGDGSATDDGPATNDGPVADDGPATSAGDDTAASSAASADGPPGGADAGVTAGATGSTGAMETGANEQDGDGGCGCSTTGTEQRGAALMLGLIGLLGIRRRRTHHGA